MAFKVEDKKTITISMFVVAFSLVIVLGTSQFDGISCLEALTSLLPCQSFLVGSGAGEPSPACCGGVKFVFDRASTTQVRRYLCQCLTDAALNLRVNPDRANKLPVSCQINLPFTLSPNIDCNSIPRA